MKKDHNIEPADSDRIETLSGRIALLVSEAHTKVAVSVNRTLVYTYYEIGRYIVEDEQNGRDRAAYGKRILSALSDRLTERLGKGWSVENLKKIRQFYVTYSKSVTTDYQIQDQNSNHWLPDFSWLWSHYQTLMLVENPEARKFYEIEATRQQWSTRELQRQIGSSLYERLALSRDNGSVMKLAIEGQAITKPTDILKDPISLEFLGLKPDNSYSKTNLENAIIDKLQQFMLEMGKGFLFEARPKGAPAKTERMD